MCSCDLVATAPDGERLQVLVGELKLAFNLDLVLQGVDRMAACDEVWLAVAASARGRGREADPRVRKLCQLLGFGLLVVGPAGRVDLLAEPGPWRPRANLRRRSRLVEEHRRRHGDPAAGGGSRTPIMTAYRQQALACAAALRDGPRRPRDLKPELPAAPAILRRNVYGWFERVARGSYGLSPAGAEALRRWPPAG
ncbi:MAG: DUF2161 family putative PD-(D/E)XK-type phosphodiesterase [Dongiaceae bacterium]